MNRLPVRDPRKPKEFFDGAMAMIGRRDVPALRAQVAAMDFPHPVVAISMAFTLFRESMELILLRYSRGDDVRGLHELFPDTVEFWEQSVATDRIAQNSEDFEKRHDLSNWRDHYQQAVWMVSLALLLEVDDDLFDRVVASLDSPTDGLLDRMIAFRHPDRVISEQVYFPKPFALLIAVIDAPAEERSALLGKFVKVWYNQSRQTYWWARHLLPEDRVAKYFGYWCLEAAAVAASLGIDDSGLAQNEYYPADLVPARMTEEK